MIKYLAAYAELPLVPTPCFVDVTECIIPKDCEGRGDLEIGHCARLA